MIVKINVKMLSNLKSKYFVQFVSIDAGLLCGLLNGMWFGPILNKISFKRIEMEEKEGVVSPDIGPKLKENATYTTLKKQFGMYHGVSTLLNLFSLAGNFYVLFYISSELLVKEQ